MSIPADWIGWFWIIEFASLAFVGIGMVLTKRR